MIDRQTLRANFEQVEAQIARACAKAGRPRSAVTLVAVSKLHPPELIRWAYELGHRDFGENYAQELRDKHAALQDLPELRWHAIGPVQAKNAKYVARAAHTFHAIDRLEVAQELDKRREGPRLQCLVEVNVAGEASKAGVSPAELPALLPRLRELTRLELVGLTTMPPLHDDPEASRAPFVELARLAREHGLAQLSMGTTGDYAVAIEAGATLVRVGTALFGART